MKRLHMYLAVALLSLTFSVGKAVADDKPVTEQLVDTFTELAGGRHEGYRANHAKGVLATGRFQPNPEAKTVTYALHLQDDPSDVIVRFSAPTGVPDIDDASPDAFPKGMAIRFLLPDEGITDIVVLSVDRFPVSTPEQFLEMLRAIHASQGSDEKPLPIEKFIAAHPAAKRFVELEKPAPEGFTTQTYHGINAFEFENAGGDKVYGRYIIEPVNGNVFLTAEQRLKAGPNYLLEELPERLATAPASFRIALQIAEAGDAINDPTVVWPQDRRIVELGILTLDSIMEDGDVYAKANMFNPLALVDGIAPSEDPILLARPTAYAISFGRRVDF